MVLNLPSNVIVFLYSNETEAWIEFLAPPVPTTVFSLEAYRCLTPLELSQEPESCQIYGITDRSEFIAQFLSSFTIKNKTVTRYTEVKAWVVVWLVVSLCVGLGVWAWFMLGEGAAARLVNTNLVAANCLFSVTLHIYGILVSYSDRLRTFYAYLGLLVVSSLLEASLCMVNFCFLITTACRLLLALYWRLMAIDLLERVIKRSFAEQQQGSPKSKEDVQKQEVFI